MERQDIKTAIDILDQVETYDGEMLVCVATVLEQCGNENAKLRGHLEIAKEALAYCCYSLVTLR